MPSLHDRLAENGRVLLQAYTASGREVAESGEVAPAAEWLLDNYHLVQAQLREIRDDLPPGYYRQLPKLADGPFAGYPRVLGLAWAFVAHTDSNFDAGSLRSFLAAYQRIQPLTTGELWAVAITLRFVLVENLRRLADEITEVRQASREADALANELAASGDARALLERYARTRSEQPLAEAFVARLAKRLRNQDPRTMPALAWLEDRLQLTSTDTEEMVHRAHQRQGAANVSVRNVITGMRSISETDWADWFESVSLVDVRLRERSDFAAMDFPTRNLYRTAIEQLARGSSWSEIAITDRVLDLVEEAAADPASKASAGTSPPGPTFGGGAPRSTDPGYFLLAEGRPELERALSFHAPWRLRLTRFERSLGVPGYVGTTALLTGALLAGSAFFLAPGADPRVLAVILGLGLLPASEIALALVNRGVAASFGATALPGLSLRAGVPASLRTMVVVPTLLSNEATLLEQIEQLEVHYLAGATGDLVFALLADGADADTEDCPDDGVLLAAGQAAIAALNARHGPAPSGARFFLLSRRRLFSASEGKWLGWERKRGKLHELNRLLRGALDTSFEPRRDDEPALPSDVRFVLTLDADTRLPRDAATRLVGKIAHPLNAPRFDARQRRVTQGYGLLQPRVTPSLPVGEEGSLLQRVFSGPAGMDPYAAAVSDVYQDLFAEGSYTGKGLYEIDAFEASLTGRIPENTLLSHDLFEGIFSRAGLCSDVEVVEESPARFDVAAKRQHRWTRGDWQLLPWAFGLSRGRAALPLLGRVKVLENLRRSLVAPFTFAALLVGFSAGPTIAARALLLLLASMAIPPFLSTLFALLPRERGIRLRTHLVALGGEMWIALLQTCAALVFLADRAWRAGDAIVRTLARLLVTRRHLLEWTTAAQSKSSPRLSLRGFAEQMLPGMLLGLLACVASWARSPEAWGFVGPAALLWLAAPAVALWASRSSREPRRLALSEDGERELRLIARSTWRFFETFVTPADNMLPPDNFQEHPRGVVAHRTSPTNIGLYLLATVAARDFGWAGRLETIERLEATFASLQTMRRFRGHFLNWYETRDLRVLPPAYVSTVDSGNLAGHLLAFANACDGWQGESTPIDVRGLLDDVALAQASLTRIAAKDSARARKLRDRLAELELRLTRDGHRGAAAERKLLRLVERAADVAESLVGVGDDEVARDLAFWIEALRRGLLEARRDELQARRPLAGPSTDLSPDERLARLAAAAREMAGAMEFGFLFDDERKLLSIGYSLADSRLDESCYDLLASEARLASLFAIAKGDLPTRHWFRLGRGVTTSGNGAVLVSWSGSMFEYLMPSLVMRAPEGSLLAQTNRRIVVEQAAYGRARGVPWGISESAYNVRDIELTYQYSNFGVPALALKRGLDAQLVVAPYATGLAAMVDAPRALANFARLAEIGARGRYGFYEAVDFTSGRVPQGERFAVVRTYMAHHQGMTIVALANVLAGGVMRARFHREPMIQAAELLLQERSPRDMRETTPRSDLRTEPARGAQGDATVVRRLRTFAGDMPITHLLSNGRYAVMLTTTGGGYSRWRDLFVTRWREDATCDPHGACVSLRDVESNRIWSPTPGPLGISGDPQEVIFAEDHASFVGRAGSVATRLDVLVSGEDDGEVRRVSLANGGRGVREIELTSYAELVLAPAATDAAHPAFAKLFVVTEHLPELGVLVATRRPRSPDEPRIFAAHFAVIEGETVGPTSYETDRARFIGRGRTLANAQALTSGEPLEGTVGTVLDPIFALRTRVLVPAGQTVRVAFWTLVAASREELLDLVDKHLDKRAYGRAETLAWTQAQVQLRHLDVVAEEAAVLQRLAAPLLYADARFRAAPETIARGMGSQAGLWEHGISGDRPIVLLRIDDLEDLGQVRALLRGQEYWRLKRLAVDLVIVNELGSSYLQDLQIAIETAVRSSQARPTAGDDRALGSVYTLRADLLAPASFALLQAVARIVLVARKGTLAEQLARVPLTHGLPSPLPATAPALAKRVSRSARPLRKPKHLELFNGLGGFDAGGTEYVVVLDAGQTTPAPWINVVANPAFGFQISAEGSGYTWSENSREHQLTPWSNDPVVDPAGEAIYVRDVDSGLVTSPTARPIRDAGRYVARHGRGYSSFVHEANGLEHELTVFVPLADPIKVSRLVLRNTSRTARSFVVTTYLDWVLGTSRGASAPLLVTRKDEETGAIFAENAWSLAFPGRVAFTDLRGRQTSCSADRKEVVGRGQSLAAPRAVLAGTPLSGRVGAGLDPCGALATTVTIEPGAAVEIVWLLGAAADAASARALLWRYRENDLDEALAEVRAHWTAVLGTVQVRTPDRRMDLLLNGWLLYQTLACRVWARSAFYQASGAYGFRDQLQDGMALTLARPAETRAHLLRSAARQFVEGDVQHWWLPHSGQGVRTRISDDRAWLAYAVATYVETTGDAAVLQEIVPFLVGAALAPGKHDDFALPTIADESASLFEHCARALDACFALLGAHGLPLMGTGDWNDGMNRVGEQGRGESVWLCWLLVRTIALFAPLAKTRDPERARRWTAGAEALVSALERHAWDGEWYRRATFDDGTWLGSKDSEACQIDSIAQSWAVLSGAAEPARAALAMSSVGERLIDAEAGIARLFAPPFVEGTHDPGYIRGYPAGLRENGGQYSHAAMWLVLAYTKLGLGDRAFALFEMLNPLHHTRNAAELERYKVEPYVLAADVYGVAPLVGRGGWTWYTGAAGWMYRAGVEGILGIRREGDSLLVDPCLPASWPGFQATVRLDGHALAIVVSRGEPGASLDDRPVSREGTAARVPIDGAPHRLQLVVR